MKIEVSVLTDNIASSRCPGEWGLSFLIETDDEKLLFDTGKSFTALHNAATIGKNLAGLSAIVLSHGHYDHTGGLRNILKQTGRVKIIGHPDIFNPKYAHRQPGSAPYYIGIPFSRPLLEKAGAEFVLTRESYPVSSSITTTGEIPMTNSFEHTDKNLHEVTGGNDYPDPLLDDLALIIDTASGLVIISGCCHRGIVNTINHAIKLTGQKRIYAVMGGFHLHNASQEQVTKTVEFLKQTGAARVNAGHCTGFKALCALHQGLGEAFTPLTAGAIFEL
ncbi:MAG: MBL fold metallo-hydrolase [Dehalococcoidaceae bacterium]|nr:MBL fold metallo-hydrolase [Dehalococcoidaceae bacterium]